MKGVLQIARIFGIPVQVHWTFLLIFVWVLIKGLGEAWNWQTIGWMMAFVMALFFCVVLHEFGHALTARRFGVDTRDIILSPIGGVARLDRLPEDPLHEFFVAVAGPAVNVGISLTLSVFPMVISSHSRDKFYNFFLSLFYPNSNVFAVGLSPMDYFLFGLIFLNIVLAVFNLLPAFPMDGGRVLRALLSMRLGRLRATRLASYVGQVLAAGLVLFGIWQFSILTAVVGVFVFAMAVNEYRMVRFDEVLRQHTVADVLRPRFACLYADQPVAAAIDRMQHGTERHFLVFDRWQNITGTLSEQRLRKLAKGDALALQQPLSDVVQKRFEALLLEDSLGEVFPKLHRRSQGILPVFEQGKLIGVVDRSGLDQFLEFKGK
jgi:Zn-dependent protease/predicted transcriptional regulator